VTSFVDNLLDDSVPVIRAYEQSQAPKRPVIDMLANFFSNLVFVPLGL
jgi:hypothetical protein